MKQVDIKGIIVPILTPMHEDESINTEVLEEESTRSLHSALTAKDTS